MAIHLTNDKSKRYVKLKYDGLHYVGEGETQTLAQILGIRNKAVFECIALHQNEECICDLTIDQISSMLGINRGSVITAIKEIEQVRYEGNPVLLKEQVGSGRKKQNIYKVLPNPLVSVYGEKFEPQNSLGTKFELQNDSLGTKFEPITDSLGSKFEHTKETKITKEINNKELEDSSMRDMTTKEVITEFVESMKKNNKEYKVVWGRDMRLAKAFLSTVTDLKNNEKKKLIEIIVESYDKWSTNTAKYPLQVSTLKIEWIQKKAREELTKEKKQMSQIQEQSVEATKRNDNELKQLSSIMSRIKSKGGKS